MGGGGSAGGGGGGTGVEIGDLVIMEMVESRSTVSIFWSGPTQQ